MTAPVILLLVLVFSFSPTLCYQDKETTVTVHLVRRGTIVLLLLLLLTPFTGIPLASKNAVKRALQMDTKTGKG